MPREPPQLDPWGFGSLVEASGATISLNDRGHNSLQEDYIYIYIECIYIYIYAHVHV